MRRAFLSLVLVAGCASSGDLKPDRPRPTDQAQLDKIREIDELFVQGGEELDAVVFGVRSDPLVSAWVTRFLILHMADAVQKQRLVQADRINFSGMEVNEQYQDALRLLKTLADAAVPTVVEELLDHRFSENRLLGVSILSEMPPMALPALDEAYRQGGPRRRRFLVEAVGEMQPGDEAEGHLLGWAADEDYLIRAIAFAGLSRYGENHLPLLQSAVATDPEQFVQRQVVKKLGQFHDKGTAATVVDFYARCVQRSDWDGVREAERALMQIAEFPVSENDRRIEKGLAYWRNWITKFAPREEND